jgi:hypothetical protein
MTIEQARAARLKTMAAVHANPTDQKAIDADNKAYAEIGKAEGELRAEQEKVFTQVEEKPDASMR